MLYAHGRYSILLIFQAMDAAGKDGVIKHVMSGINPEGFEVFSFKQPSSEELKDDFCGARYAVCPSAGGSACSTAPTMRKYSSSACIRRSLLPGASDELLDEKTMWKGRFRSIVDLEKHLHRNGTRCIKFFLHLSKDEQRKRFLERIDNPDKNWKISFADIQERDYLEAV